MTNIYRGITQWIGGVEACFAIWATTGCDVAGKDDVSQSPAGYNLNKPYIMKLPLELDEISGVAFHDSSKSIFAINDERGWLYKIRAGYAGEITKWKFADGADFEDLV